MIAGLVLWAVFIIGPNNYRMPLHHYQPMVWSTEDGCRAEIDRTLAEPDTFMGPEFHLECVAVFDLRGEPA